MIRARRLVEALIVVATAAFDASCAKAASADPCDRLPIDVTTYLSANPTWIPVRKSDLSADHQKLWEDSHRNMCPGVATVDLEGRGRASHGLALLRRDRRGNEEMLVLLRRRPKGLSITTMVAPYRSPGPEVVWEASPALAQDLAAGSKFGKITHDAIVFEALESAAQMFYVRNGRVRKIQISD